MSRASPTGRRAQAADGRSRGTAAGWRGHALALCRLRHADLQPSIVATSEKALGESAIPDMQVTSEPGSFKGSRIGDLEEAPGLQMPPLSGGAHDWLETADKSRGYDMALRCSTYSIDRFN
jgi:hypothetical protein